MADDWPSYNEALVKRGEILLDLSLLQGWGEELEEMNRGKEGARYRYPYGLIKLQGLLRALFRLPYRQLEGFTHALSRWEPRLRVPDYTTTCRRVNVLSIDLEPRLDPGRPVTIAVDASGVKVADRGEWMRAKWRRRRGFLKIHLAVDVEKKQIVSMEVTDERTGDGVMLVPLVTQARRRCNVARVLGDGAYDSRHNFQHLAAKGIEPGIKVRKNSSPRARGCPARRLAVLEQLGDPEAWKRRVGYGGRWMAETAFSVIKRVFGEYVMARSFPNMVQEMLLKVSLYNLFMSLNPCV
jgi:IS5 family transposase